MTFASIPKQPAFLDANTLVYYFTADLRYGALASNSWTGLLGRRFRLHLGARGHRRGPSGDDP